VLSVGQHFIVIVSVCKKSVMLLRQLLWYICNSLKCVFSSKTRSVS